jgi:acyl dehydratase
MSESIVDKMGWREYIGRETGSGTGDPVLFRDIRRYALAIDDPNPIYHDEGAAEKSRYRGMVAPLGFFWFASTGSTKRKKRAKDLGEDGLSINEFLGIPDIPNIWTLGWTRGGEEIEFYKPIRVGDQITVRCRLVDMYEKGGKSGKLLFVVSEHSYTNQKGELLAKQRLTFIGMPRRDPE